MTNMREGKKALCICVYSQNCIKGRKSGCAKSISHFVFSMCTVRNHPLDS